MFNLFSLSWRNIWRQRGRSLITVGVVALAVFYTLLFRSFLGAFENSLYLSLTDSAGHLQVRVADYRNKRELRDQIIPDVASIKAQLEQSQLPSGTQTVVSLEVPALLSGEGRSRGVLLVGKEQPNSLQEQFSKKYLKQGQLPQAGDRDGIALGMALANALKVKLGDLVYVYAPGTEGSGAAAYKMVGLVKLPDNAADVRTAFISLAAAQDLAAPGGATRIELHLPYIRLNQDSALANLQPSLASTLGSKLTVENWREANPSLAQILKIIGPLGLSFTLIFFGLAGLLVVNTIYLSLLERTREFGVIVALGAGPAKMTRMVLLESVLLCFSGALVGAALGLLLVVGLSRGIPTEALYGKAAGDFGMPEVLYVSLGSYDLLVTLILALLTGLIAAWWPARVAAGLQPVEAMRFTA
jgi:ABC-type lipoprotein release transport system permease subunit